ncbi:MAG: site-specific integrase [Muribaculum sp.]|nr:site-specific integrase [Muribaculum sp.]
MTSIKLFFRESTIPQVPGSLYFRIVHKRKISILNTGVKILPHEWNKSDSSITGNQSSLLMSTINQIKSRLENIVAILENSNAEYSTRDILDMYHDSESITGIISLARSMIKDCRQIGNHSATEHFTTVTNNFQTFLKVNLGVDDIPFDKFDSHLMARYEAHLKQYGLCPNTTSSYMRKLRVIYNTAVERKLTTQIYPFKHVYTGVAKTEKRATSLDVLKRLRDLDLSNSFYDKLARDMFLFSFYTRGMSTIDMAYLKKTISNMGCLPTDVKKPDKIFR